MMDELERCFVSECECDNDGEKGANVVDALFAIARVLNKVANAITQMAYGDMSSDTFVMPECGLNSAAERIREAIGNVASAIAEGNE